MARWIKSVAIALTLLTLMSTAASAQSLNAASSNDKPLQVDATDGIEWDRNTETYKATGNVVAKQGATTLYSDVLTAFYRQAENKNEAGDNTEIYRLHAEGNVHITSPEQEVFGDDAVYTLDDGIFKVTGQNLRLKTKTETVLARDSLEYSETEQVAYAHGDATILREKNKLRADSLKAYFEKTAAGSTAMKDIYARNNVLITTPQEIARGDKGHYDTKTGIATLIDNVSITRGKNQLYGDMAEVNLNTGISKLISKTKPNEKKRVRALFKKDEKEDTKQ